MALDWLKRGEPREPGDPRAYALQRSYAYRLMGRCEDALEEFAKLGDLQPFQQLSRSICLVQLGRIKEAKAGVLAALADDASFSQQVWREGSFYSNPAVVDGEVEALAKAGLPRS